MHPCLASWSLLRPGIAEATGAPPRCRNASLAEAPTPPAGLLSQVSPIPGPQTHTALAHGSASSSLSHANSRRYPRELKAPIIPIGRFAARLRWRLPLFGQAQAFGSRRRPIVPQETRTTRLKVPWPLWKPHSAARFLELTASSARSTVTVSLYSQTLSVSHSKFPTVA
jgi:hypothetical protein